MNLGQTMISTAFFVLLTLAVLTADKMIIERSKGELQLTAVEGATNLANALLTEILTKKFDSKVTTDANGNITGPYTHDNWPWPSTPTSFDAPSAMGTSSSTMENVMPGGKPDSITVAKPYYYSTRGDSPSWFDDVDDYVGSTTEPYVRAASSGSLTGYRLTVSVYYVKKTSPNVAASNQTFYKRIDVTVTNSLYLSKSLVFSAIATY
jgi:hypothetical protein